MEQQVDVSGKISGQKELWKFPVLSVAGVLLFFAAVWKGNIPVVAMINGTKALLGEKLELVAVISSLLLGVGLIVSCFPGMDQVKDYFKDAGLRKIFWICGIGIVILKLLKVPVFFIEDPNIGGKILNLGSTVFITIAVAGSLVIFIIRSGLVEFIAVLMEPVMRPVFKLPGEAAVNILSSFVSSASVGVFFTEQYYQNKRYTTRQACSVVSSFSVISVGYIGVLASLCDIGDMYGTLLAVSFVSVLVMGAIMVRIPPLSRIPDTMIDGSKEECIFEKLTVKERFAKAVQAGHACAKTFTTEAFVKNVIQSFSFAQKIVGVMIPTVTLVLTLVYYTPLFTWLGKPFVLLLSLFRVPDAAMAAPSVLIGIVEVSLPSILIGGTAAAVQTRFFVALLSVIQIIFFSEAGNAILASKIPLGFGKLIEIFLVRTLVGIPVAAFFSMIICTGL